MVADDLSTNSQKNLVGCRPITNTCMTNEGWASGTSRISLAKRVIKRERDSSSFWLNPRRIAMDGLGRTLARNLNSLASWSKDEIEDDLSRLYHTRAEPQRVVGNARHIRASKVPYRAIWALKAMTCSTGSESPL